MTRTPARCRDSIPPMCIRHEESPATSTSAPESTTLRALSAPIATEVSEFFTANVPPKPQHDSAVGQLDEPDARDGAQQRQRPVTHPEHAQRVAGRVVGHGVRERGAHVGHPEHVDEELGQLEHPGRDVRDRGREPAITGPPGDDPVLVPRRSGARARRRDDVVVALEGRHEVADHGHGLVEVAGVHHRLRAARLRRRELHVDAEPAQQRHDRLPRGGEHRVVDARHHQRHPHAAHPCTAARRQPGLGGVPVGRLDASRARSGRAPGWSGPASRIAVQVREVRAERARLHQDVAQRGRLDRSGEDRQAAGRGGEPAEQVVARPAAHDVHDVDGDAGQLGGLPDDPAVGQRQAVEDAPHDGGLGSTGPAGPESSQAATIRASMSPGGRNSGASTSTTDCQWGHVGRLPQQVRQDRPAGPRQSQLRIASESTQRPDTLRRNLIVRSTPPSLVKSACRAASLSTGSSSSTPDQRPGARGDVRRPRAVGERHRHDGGRGVVRTDRDRPGCAAAGPTARGDVRQQRAEGRPGVAERRAGCRAGTPDLVGERRRPVARAHVVQLGGGGVRPLGADRTGQPVGQQVRDEQHRLRPVEQVRRRDELVEGVERAAAAGRSSRRARSPAPPWRPAP